MKPVIVIDDILNDLFSPRRIRYQQHFVAVLLPAAFAQHVLFENNTQYPVQKHINSKGIADNQTRNIIRDVKDKKKGKRRYTHNNIELKNRTQLSQSLSDKKMMVIVCRKSDQNGKNQNIPQNIALIHPIIRPDKMPIPDIKSHRKAQKYTDQINKQNQKILHCPTFLIHFPNSVSIHI